MWYNINVCLNKKERMIQMEGNKETKKKRTKGTAGKIAGKIIAALMVAFMLIASCSTAIYYLINS